MCIHNLSKLVERNFKLVLISFNVDCPRAFQIPRPGIMQASVLVCAGAHIKP